MSAVILELADFLLEVAHTKEQQKAAITITCIAGTLPLLGWKKLKNFLMLTSRQ
ncbi:MAG: hypothetical protein H0U75_04450 [Legionella sp.]|nr:hypothetical protein [Legionella sp.]